jgi:hypothetical protein
VVKKILLILVIVIALFGCEYIGGYKPITLSMEDFQNIFNNPVNTISDSNLWKNLWNFSAN